MGGGGEMGLREKGYEEKGQKGRDSERERGRLELEFSNISVLCLKILEVKSKKGCCRI